MASAWIAWRVTDAVREHCADYRENCLLWFPGSRNIPTGDGIEFKRIDGYELRSLRRSTSGRLLLIESYLGSTEKLPTTSQMTITKAEKELFVALAAGHLIALAKDNTGKIVEIPQREWPYLQIFEEQESDVLKHNALDATPAFTKIKFWRKDLRGLCPACGSWMHRRTSYSQLAPIQTFLDVTIVERSPRLRDSRQSPTNDHLQEGRD
jgi:hypothetical protein